MDGTTNKISFWNDVKDSNVDMATLERMNNGKYLHLQIDATKEDNSGNISISKNEAMREKEEAKENTPIRALAIPMNAIFSIGVSLFRKKFMFKLYVHCRDVNNFD